MQVGFAKEIQKKLNQSEGDREERSSVPHPVSALPMSRHHPSPCVNLAVFDRGETHYYYYCLVGEVFTCGNDVNRKTPAQLNKKA